MDLLVIHYLDDFYASKSKKTIQNAVATDGEVKE